MNYLFLKQKQVLSRRRLILLGGASLISGCSTSAFNKIPWQESNALAFDTTQPFDIHKKYGPINFITVSVPECLDEKQFNLPLPHDLKADVYYKAAYKIHGERNERQYKQMYILARQAADMGHWRAKLLLAEVYMRRSKEFYAEYKPNQARAYINELMTHHVPAAFYGMSQYRNKGYQGFSEAPAPASFYLYRAAQLGHPQSVADIANIFLTVRRHAESAQLLSYGLQYGGGGEMAYDRAISYFLNARTEEDWIHAYEINYAAAKTGHKMALHTFLFEQDKYMSYHGGFSYLSDEFLKRADRLQFAVEPHFRHDDPWRKRKGLPYSIAGNVTLKYPRLERVLPLPPAKMPNWDGDIALAMSDEGAKDYRTDYDYETLVKEIQR